MTTADTPKVYLHINRPSSTRFIARVRRHGHRKYRVIGKPTRSQERAILAMARAFASGDYKRGEVLLTADWYDPIVIVKVTR